MSCLESRAETEHHPHQKGESFTSAGGEREEALQDERQPCARTPGGSARTQRARGGRRGDIGAAALHDATGQAFKPRDKLGRKSDSRER